jgi:hypothetical protein
MVRETTTIRTICDAMNATARCLFVQTHGPKKDGDHIQIQAQTQAQTMT